MDDRQLVFVISQPRSGSTLLQRLLTGHPSVTGTAEPWVMLPLLWPLREGGSATDYNARHARRGIAEFGEAVGRPDVWRAASRAAADVLYAAAAEAGDATHVVDKTPRYYHVIDDLHAVFPDATFVLLVRHPLDVLTSIWLRHCQGDWTGLARRDRRHDLLTAPAAISAAATSLPAERRVVVRYRDLVADPRPSLEAICRAAGLGFDDAMLGYTRPAQPGMGDQWGIDQHDTPVGDYVDAWDQRLDAPWKREFALAHLEGLGNGLLRARGLDPERLRDRLATGSASARRTGRTRWEAVATAPELRSARQRALLAGHASVHARGPLRAAARLVVPDHRTTDLDPDWGVELP